MLPLGGATADRTVLINFALMKVHEASIKPVPERPYYTSEDRQFLVRSVRSEV